MRIPGRALFVVPAAVGAFLAMAGPCIAGTPFACKANGDTWSISGTPARKSACTLRCILRDASGGRDTVSCSPTVSPDENLDAVCDGFLTGRHWTSALLVASECATVAH